MAKLKKLIKLRLKAVQCSTAQYNPHWDLKIVVVVGRWPLVQRERCAIKIEIGPMKWSGVTVITAIIRSFRM
jgi:hypothetical protein